MSSSDTKTVWFRNVDQDTLHEVVVGSPEYKRLRGEQAGDADSEKGIYKLYEPVSDSDLRKVKPESLPGYVDPDRRRPGRDQGNGGRQEPVQGPSEDEIQARVDAAVAKALAAQSDSKTTAQPDEGAKPSTDAAAKK